MPIDWLKIELQAASKEVTKWSSGRRESFLSLKKTTQKIKERIA